MAIIPIDLLEAGMVLKADVRDRSGRLILPAGAELAEKQIKTFRTWGITEADILHGPDGVEVDAAHESSNVDPLLFAAAEQAVHEIFRLNDAQHPMIKELMRVCLGRRLTNVAR